MKTKVLDLQGKEKGNIDLPKQFSSPIREDVVAKVLRSDAKQHPYAPSLVAGKQHKAKGKIVHRRHVWRSGYGRGQSRVPRKIFSQKGMQFNWEAAEVPQARGGMRAHPPKVKRFLKKLKSNKKERKLAIGSALSATADKKWLLKRYSSIEEINKEVPFVISLSEKPKTKDILSGIKKVLGKELQNIAIRKKSTRAGKGKLRGRKYKSNAGLLLVIGNDEKLKTKMFEIKKANELSLNDLARGGLGRLTIYSEKAIKDLKDKLNPNKKQK